jgi:hypothetical protein
MIEHKDVGQDRRIAQATDRACTATSIVAAEVSGDVEI